MFCRLSAVRDMPGSPAAALAVIAVPSTAGPPGHRSDEPRKQTHLARCHLPPSPDPRPGALARLVTYVACRLVIWPVGTCTNNGS